MQDVTKDRHLYIGGSDIPIIMNISQFKSRWELLQEKCQLIESDFMGNIYSEYGNDIEPKIREYINGLYFKDFKEGVKISGNKRYHSDGVCTDTVLEIKSTSQIYENVEDYQAYLVQLLFGMQLEEKENGILAVYERPEDFSLEFEPRRLQIFEININDFKLLLGTVNNYVDKFCEDWEKLKKDNSLQEIDFVPKDMVNITTKILKAEEKLEQLKNIESEIKALKQKLKTSMESTGIKKWETPKGIKISLVSATNDKEEEVFNEQLFKEDFAELHKQYLVLKTKKGKSGYVRITMPKQ